MIVFFPDDSMKPNCFKFYFSVERVYLFCLACSDLVVTSYMTCRKYTLCEEAWKRWSVELRQRIHAPYWILILIFDLALFCKFTHMCQSLFVKNRNELVYAMVTRLTAHYNWMRFACNARNSKFSLRGFDFRDSVLQWILDKFQTHYGDKLLWLLIRRCHRIFNPADNDPNIFEN